MKNKRFTNEVLKKAINVAFKLSKDWQPYPDAHSKSEENPIETNQSDLDIVEVPSQSVTAQIQDQLLYQAENEELIVISPSVVTTSNKGKLAATGMQEADFKENLKKLLEQKKVTTAKVLVPVTIWGTFSPHVILQYREYNLVDNNLTENEENRKSFDPRKIKYGQKGLDDTNCGRYVAAMTVIAASSLKNSKQIHKETFALPILSYAKDLNEEEELGEMLQQIASNPNQQENMLNAAKYTYEKRKEKSLKYLSSCCLYVFSRFFGFSAENKAKATEDINNKANKQGRLKKIREFK